MDFREHIYNLLPGDTKAMDSNGILKRFISVAEDEIHFETLPFIEAFVHNVYGLINPNYRFIPELSTMLGKPSSPDIATKRNLRELLAYIVDIYKIKGTADSFKLYFSIFGYTINIVEDIPEKVGTYDDVLIYDDTQFHYDMECESCTFYDIEVEEPMSIEVQESFEKVLCFLSPINAKFRSFITP